jgi:hypothetical protein
MRSNSWIPVSLALMAAATVSTVTMRAEPAASSSAGRFEQHEYREVTLPAGTVLPLTLETTVASNSSHVEDRVQARLRRAVVVNGRTVLPAGAPVSGVVTEARQSGRVKGRARVGMRFTSLSTHDENYRLRTASIVREAPGTKKKDAEKIGIPAGAGALIGALAGGKKGAAIGAAAGGGGGTAVVLATRGQEVRLGRGASVAARLVQPLTVRVPMS